MTDGETRQALSPLRDLRIDRSDVRFDAVAAAYMRHACDGSEWRMYRQHLDQSRDAECACRTTGQCIHCEARGVAQEVVQAVTEILAVVDAIDPPRSARDPEPMAWLVYGGTGAIGVHLSREQAQHDADDGYGKVVPLYAAALPSPETTEAMVEAPCGEMLRWDVVLTGNPRVRTPAVVGAMLAAALRAMAVGS